MGAKVLRPFVPVTRLGGELAGLNQHQSMINDDASLLAGYSLQAKPSHDLFLSSLVLILSHVSSLSSGRAIPSPSCYKDTLTTSTENVLINYISCVINEGIGSGTGLLPDKASA